MAAIFNPTVGLHNMWYPNSDGEYAYEHSTLNQGMAGPHIDIESCDPLNGPAQQPFNVCIKAYFNFSTNLTYAVSFNGTKIPADVTVLGSHEDCMRYLVSTTVPAPPAISADPQETVPVFLVLQQLDGNQIAAKFLGDFAYTDASTWMNMQPQAQPGFAISGGLTTSMNMYGGNAPTENIPESRQFAPAAAHLGSSWPLANSSRMIDAPDYHHLHRQQPQRSISDQSMSVPDSYRRRKSPSLGSGLIQTLRRQSESPVLQSTESPSQNSRTVQQSSSRQPRNPALIRTSTLHAHISHLTLSTSASSASVPSPAKAVLQLNGDLDSLDRRWTQEEQEHNRRLVEFSRNQQGNRIVVSFWPVPLKHAQTNKGIYISCIWWPDRQEAFITSVDTIYLLETFIGVKFTVEEKNRIRRNLEGFRPQTVSKHRADSEPFFRMLMGLENPKPRNIEKDVKVFPWKILSNALNKIIGKYSASYTSAPHDDPGHLPRIDAPSDSSSSAAPPPSQTSHTASPDQLSRSASPQVHPMYTPRPDERQANLAVQYDGGGQEQGYYSTMLHSDAENVPRLPDFHLPVHGWSYEQSVGRDFGRGHPNPVATPGMHFGGPHAMPQHQRHRQQQPHMMGQMGTGEDSDPQSTIRSFQPGPRGN